MAQDGKSVAERASELREFANKILSLSDEELEKVVGGVNSEDLGWSILDAWREEFFTNQP